MTGLTIFWLDKGIDTGPILLQKEVRVDPNDTTGTLYFNKLFPMGIEAIGEAVDLTDDDDSRIGDGKTVGAVFVEIVAYPNPFGQMHPFVDDRAMHLRMTADVDSLEQNRVLHVRPTVDANVRRKNRSLDPTARNDAP